MGKRQLTPERLAMLERRQEIGRRYLRGETQASIAAAVGIGQGAVSRHLARLRDEWRQSALGSIGDKLARELARIDQIERAAWAAIEASNSSDAKAAEPGSGSPAKPKPLSAAKASELLRWAVEQRCKLFGLYAPTKVAPTNPKGDQPYQPWNAEQLQEFAQSLSDDELETMLGLESRLAGKSFPDGMSAGELTTFARSLTDNELETLLAMEGKLSRVGTCDG